MRKARFSTALLAIALLARCASIWYGFDRLPYLSNGEEAAQNDQAVSLSRGAGMVGRSYAGLFTEAGFLGHHMPVYILAQAAVFRAFGFSAWTLRGTGIAANLAADLVAIILLTRLLAAGLIGRLTWLLAGLALLFEPSAMLYVRMGRSDSLTSFFGMLACLALFGRLPNPISGGRRVAAAVLVGLAGATHPVGVMYWFALAASLCFLPPRPRAVVCLATLALPAAVMAGLWGLAYGGNSAEALREMIVWARTSAEMPVTAAALFDAARHGSVVRFLELGGVMLCLFNFGGLALLAACFAAGRKTSAPRPFDSRLAYALALTFVAQSAALYLYFGTWPTRMVVVMPVAVVTVAVAVSALPVLARRGCCAILAGIVLFEAAATAGVLSKVRAEYKLRDPGRFAALVASLPPDASLAADYSLWYTLVRARRPFRIVNFGVAIDRSYWTADPARFDRFDVVVAREGAWKDLHMPMKRPFRRVVISNEPYLVFTR